MRRKGNENPASKLMAKYKNSTRPVQRIHPRPIPLASSPEPTSGVSFSDWLRDFVPLSSTQVTSEPNPVAAAPNVVFPWSGHSNQKPQRRGRPTSRGQGGAQSSDSSGSSPPRLALEGLARLKDSIRDIAKERRQQIILEGADLGDKMVVATKSVESARLKLESLHCLHQTWADKIPGAQNAHNRAIALRTKAHGSASTEPPSAHQTDQTTVNTEVESIWGTPL
ncbi:hypothetical protein KC19_VG244500 [Ceratodon purpureus]|uniref:Uncharacterized protein n=1 Tax=Ceratodon purpureus TaxID=3225 RepID=A0A8T0HTP4_CERPU|nr:hypothetical protein KC19_VG244500 [Ceratodon purpureus]